MTIEDVSEPREKNKGGTSNHLMEINEHYIPLPENDADDNLEIVETPDQKASPLY